MNTTNNNDEATRLQYDSEDETRIENNGDETTAEEDSSAPTGENAGKKWRKVASGIGSGVLAGGIAATVMGMTSADHEQVTPTENNNNNRDELSHPEWVDDQVAVATSTNDSMSFNEAFAAARAEVGPGGCFEWHGQLYNTYYAEEWNSMTAGQRAEYGQHFSWNQNHYASSHSNEASNTPTGKQSSIAGEDGGTQQGTSDNRGGDSTDSDIEVISVTHHDTPDSPLQTADNPTPGTTLAAETQPQEGEHEIELIGLYHDDDSGANIGGMTIDGQEVVLIDVDGNMQFDLMASDVNGNGQLDQEEFLDVSDQGLMVNDMFGGTGSDDSLYCSTDNNNPISDGVYEG